MKSSTEVRSPTSTKAYTQGNITVTGGAGKGNTRVNISMSKAKPMPKSMLIKRRK